MPGRGNNDNFFMPMILSKQLGHPEIKNSKHWKITNECFICDKWKYTVIFWDMKKLGTKFQIKDPILEDAFEELILQNDRFEEMLSERAI